ncbi:hypothetical protein ACFY1U_46210 [Streptomyces sp. NPDC001351]|uniref:hypothetical protein n=1 Tax=Streptomyces sp. NPDC001351 TaxID=3364564 RepID=UPI00369B7737
MVIGPPTLEVLRINLVVGRQGLHDTYGLKLSLHPQRQVLLVRLGNSGGAYTRSQVFHGLGVIATIVIHPVTRALKRGWFVNALHLRLSIVEVCADCEELLCREIGVCSTVPNLDTDLACLALKGFGGLAFPVCQDIVDGFLKVPGDAAVGRLCVHGAGLAIPIAAGKDFMDALPVVADRRDRSRVGAQDHLTKTVDRVLHEVRFEVLAIDGLSVAFDRVGLDEPVMLLLLLCLLFFFLFFLGLLASWGILPPIGHSPLPSSVLFSELD